MRLTEREAQEYKRCAESVLYTLRYVYIKHISRGRMKWRPYENAPEPFWQTELLQLTQDENNVVLLKSRQVGASWTVAIFVAWLLHFRPDVEVLLLSQTEKKAIKLLSKVKFISKNFPQFIRRRYSADTLTKFSVIHERRGTTIVRESVVESLTSTSGSGRGDTARFVFFDELAHLDNAEDVWTAVKPTTSHGGQIVVASSPKGNVGTFARLWLQAEAGDSTFVPMKVHYTSCGFDQKWLKDASDGMTDNQILQEYELVFVGTGTPAFDASQIKDCYYPDGVPEEIASLRIRKKYATGIDSAEIRAGNRTRQRDYNAVVTLNEYGVQVAAEANKMLIDEWAGKTIDTKDGRFEVKGFVTQWHEKYPGLMFIEENGAGLTVLNRHQTPNDGVSRCESRRMTGKSKPRLVNQLALALAGQQIIITDKNTYYQLLMYEDLGNGRYEAPKGMHDDLVVALMLAYDALIEMGGYEFTMPGSTVGNFVSPIDPGFGPTSPTLPSIEEFLPDSGMGPIFNANEWSSLEPGRMSINDLRSFGYPE
jgi:hypothetical protein